MEKSIDSPKIGGAFHDSEIEALIKRSQHLIQESKRLNSESIALSNYLDWLREDAAAQVEPAEDTPINSSL